MRALSRPARSAGYNVSSARIKFNTIYFASSDKNAPKAQKQTALTIGGGEGKRKRGILSKVQAHL